MLEYRHMMPLERPIWSRFLEATDLEILAVEYDVHVGRGAEIDPAWSEATKRQVLATSRKRIDAVLHTPEAIIICEVKPRAGMGALGQLLAYRQLYIKEHPTGREVKMAVVCERVEPDVPEVMAQHGITIYRV